MQKVCVKVRILLYPLIVINFLDLLTFQINYNKKIFKNWKTIYNN